MNDLERLCEQFNARHSDVRADYRFTMDLGPGVMVVGELAGYVVADFFWEPTIDDLEAARTRMLEILAAAVLPQSYFANRAQSDPE